MQEEVAQPLSELFARALIGRWLGHGVQHAPLTPPRGGFAHERIEVQFLSHSDDLAATHRDALALRRAMEGLNALACCRGLSIHENAAFWRRELSPVVGHRLSDASARFHAFAPDMLTRFRVITEISTSPDATAWAIATCFSMDPDSEAMQVRREVHEQLCVSFTRVPPMLDIEMAPVPSDAVRLNSPEAYWRLVKRSFLEATRLWTTSEASSERERIHLVCDTVVDGGGLVETSELTALSSVVELREFRLVVTESDPATIARQLSLFMRELVRVDTVRKMAWRFTCCDRPCLEAIYSAIPAMKSLESFSIECDELVSAAATTVWESSMHVRSYYAWFGFAIALLQLDGRPVRAGVDLVHGNEELVNRALQSPSALLGVVSIQQGITPVLLAYGSSASLRSRLILTSDITVTERLRELTVSIVVEQGERVDVVALCGSRAVVVWPGCGLLCVDAGDLHEWKTRLVNPSTCPPIVNTLACWRSQATAIAGFVSLIGSGLRRLCVGNIRVEGSVPFKHILAACPRLNTLCVSSLDAVGTLLNAYEDTSCRVSTLQIGVASTTTLHAMLHLLGDNTNRIAQQVRQLYIEIPSVLSEDDVDAIASMLRRNRRLTYLRLVCGVSADDDEVPRLDAIHEFVDAPVVQTHESRRGAYTFLLAARRHRVLRLLPIPCARAIAAFAAMPERRHVSWEQR